MTKTLIGSLAGASLAALALTAGSALAADMGKPVYKAPPPAPAPVYSWTGCYIDAGGGYGLWNQDRYDDPLAPVPGSITTTSGGRGWLGRVGGGCDYQIAPRWVVGAFGDYDFMRVHGAVQDSWLGVAGDENESRAWAVGGRFGYLVTPDVLAYFDGGYTQTRFDQENPGWSVPPFTPGPGVYLAAQNYNGWFIGGGTDVSLASLLPGLPTGLFLRSEYRYSGYGGADNQVICTSVVLCGALGPTLDVHIQPYVQTATTSLVWRFNFSGPVVTRD